MKSLKSRAAAVLLISIMCFSILLSVNIFRILPAHAIGVIDTIPVGTGPYGVAYDSLKGEIFVANYGSGTVSVINDATNTVVATVTVGTNPQGVAYDSGKGEIFVANYGSGTVSVINDATNTVVATVSVGGAPDAVAYDAGNGKLYVPNWSSGSVSVIDDSSNTVVATVSVGTNPSAAAYDSGQHEIFVANQVSNTVSVISDFTNTVSITVFLPSGLAPDGVAYDSGKGEIFVANWGSASVSVIDDSTNAVGPLPVSVGNFPRAAAFDSGKSEIYVNNWNDGTVSVIKTDLYNMVVATLPVGTTPAGVAYDSGKGEIFVTNSGSNTVSVISDSPPSITLSESSGLVGDSVTVMGSGFDSYKTITMRYWSGDLFEYLPSFTSDGSGGFVTSFIVPASTEGSHYVDAIDTSGQGAGASFTVTPSIVLGVSSGTVGSYLAISGSGFGSDSWITISYDGKSLYDPAFSSDQSGDFYASTYVPPSVAGPHTVSAIDVPGNSATATFTVTPAIVLSPTGGLVGDPVTVTCSGFAGSSAITITYNGVTQVASGSSDSYGSFATSFTVPASAAGSYPVSASDSMGNSSSAIFTVGVPGYITILNVLQGGSTSAPPSSWNYTITEEDTSNVVDTFQLPAGGGGSHAFAASFGVYYIVTATPKYGYDTTIYGDAGIGYSHVYPVYIGEYEAVPYEEEAYLDNGGWATITFTNSFEGAFATQSLTQVPPSGVSFSIPPNQPFPIQAAWNVTLKNDGIIDLVVNKTMAILVNFTQTVAPGQAVNITVTFSGTTYGQVVQQNVLAQDNVIVFEPIVPKSNGTMTITGTHQIGTTANPSSLTGNPMSLASTVVVVKDTINLPLYFYNLNRTDYGSVNATDVALMVGNTTAFINATYPVKNVVVGPSVPTIPGNVSSNSPSKFQGIINDCISVSVQAAKSSYGKVTRGIGIGPNNRPGQQDYFTYHGAPGGAGFTVNPNCHGVVVLDGYYTAAAHEVGHTFGLNWPPTSEEYVTYPQNGKATSGIWPEQNQWRTGYDIMGTAPYRTLDWTWIDRQTYAQLFSLTKAVGNDPDGLLIVSGLIHKDGTVDLPQTWYELQSGVPDMVVPGNYALRFYDANGNVILTTSFDAPFSVQIDPGVTVGQNMPDLSNFGTVQTDVAGFAFTVPYPQGTAKVQIIDNTDPNNPIVMNTVSAADIVYVPPAVNIKFTTSGIGSDTNDAPVMTIDNTLYSYSQLQSLSFDWTPGSNHTVTIYSPIAAVAGKQYAFTCWTNGDGLKSGTSNYTVPNIDTVVTANFKTQFQLTITTNPPGLIPQPWVTPCGTGAGGRWYDANTIVTLIASPLAINTLRNWYTFNYWVLDGAPQKTNVLQLKIKMDQAHTAIANYAHFKMNGYFTDNFKTTINSFTCTTAPMSEGGYKITATNPATFYYNLQITNNDPTGTFTIALLVPSDFALTPLSPGASPVQIDGKNVAYSMSSLGLLIISNVQIKQNQMITISAHLKYADSFSSKVTFSKDYPFIATVNLVQLTTTIVTAIGKPQ